MSRFVPRTDDGPQWNKNAGFHGAARGSRVDDPVVGAGRLYRTRVEEREGRWGRLRRMSRKGARPTSQAGGEFFSIFHYGVWRCAWWVFGFRKSFRFPLRLFLVGPRVGGGL